MYAHALVLNADHTNPWVTVACNADAQHWAHTSVAREARSRLIVRTDGRVGEPLDPQA